MFWAWMDGSSGYQMSVFILPRGIVYRIYWRLCSVPYAVFDSISFCWVQWALYWDGHWEWRLSRNFYAHFRQNGQAKSRPTALHFLSILSSSLAWMSMCAIFFHFLCLLRSLAAYLALSVCLSLLSLSRLNLSDRLSHFLLLCPTFCSLLTSCNLCHTLLSAYSLSVPLLSKGRAHWAKRTLVYLLPIPSALPVSVKRDHLWCVPSLLVRGSAASHMQS